MTAARRRLSCASPRRSRPRIGITVSIGLSGQQVPGQGRVRSREAARLHGPRRRRTRRPSWRRGPSPSSGESARRAPSATPRTAFGPSPTCRGQARASLRAAMAPRACGWPGSSFGRDHRRVDPDGERKSVSAETTFDHDLATRDDLLPILWTLVREGLVAPQEGADGGRHGDVEAQVLPTSRSGPAPELLHEPTRLATRLFEAGRELLSKETDGTRYRLIGIGVVGSGGPRRRRSAATWPTSRPSACSPPRRRSTRCARSSARRGQEGYRLPGPRATVDADIERACHHWC